MVQYVINPWRTRAELLTVREQLYSPIKSSLEDPDRRHAVEKISVWMQRGNCPHLVESTAILTAAKLNDVPANSNYCIRAAYSAAFSRFVTGLLDGHQDKRRKLSMYSIAKTIGLPATFVELRHQATHEELPSVPKLRTATEKALSWIWEHYWSQLSLHRPETRDCQAYLASKFKDNKEHSDGDLEAWKRKWSLDELHRAVADIMRTTNDSEILMQAVRLSSKLTAEDVKLEPEEVAETEILDIEQVKADLARKARDMTDPKEETGSGDESAAILDETAAGKGWKIWKGSWTPAPIGTLC